MKRSVLAFASLFYFLAPTAEACDLCAIYNSARLQQPARNSLQLGVHEQFAEYNKVQADGKHVENTSHQHLISSITQLYADYGFNESVSVNLSLPYINRSYKRPDGAEIEEGSEAGIGDLTILGRWIPYERKVGDTIFVSELSAGLKLPTGDSDRLREEAEEGHEEEPAHHEDEEQDGHGHSAARHGGVNHGTPSAVHGHDLALGSGSIDFPIGARFFYEEGRAFMSGDVQYLLRTEGDHDYRFANDLLWNYGPGYQLVLHDEFALAGRVKLSGEHKANDSQNGEASDDTAISAIYLGPQAMISTGDGLSMDIGVDWPLYQDNSGLQAVNSYKLHGAVSYRF